MLNKNWGFGAKKRPAGIPMVRAKDPLTGMSAKSMTRGGAIFKLEAKLMKKVPNLRTTRGR